MAKRRSARPSSLPAGLSRSPGVGSTASFWKPRSQLAFIGPLALVLIFMILFALYGNFKFPVSIALGVIMTEPVGALVALKLTHTPFSVSSVLGLLALLGVSVETAVILVSYINKLRLEGMDIRTATREASLLRLRPIMMTALVACLGLLPAALSTGIGSDTQKPFAIVIVAGLVSRLLPRILCQSCALRAGRPRRRRPAGVTHHCPRRDSCHQLSSGAKLRKVLRNAAIQTEIPPDSRPTPGYPGYFCAICVAPVVH